MYDLRMIQANFEKFPQFKAAVLEAMAEIGKPLTYSNEDVDRRGHLHGLMEKGSKPTLRLETVNWYGKGEAPKIWMA